jgi:protein TonB
VLLVSLAVQAGLLAALVLVPLVATSERVFALRMTPLPLPRGSLRGKPHANTNSSGPHHTNIIRPIPYDRSDRPPRVPHRPQPNGAGSEGAKNPGTEYGSAWGIPDGVLPPGTDGDTRWIFQPLGPARPPAETQKNRVVRSEGVQQAFLTQRVQPVYPPLAVQMRLEGTVQLHAVIGRDGAVTALEVLSGHSILAQAAFEAVRQWRYRPTLLNGKPVEVETYITVIFQLQR